MAAIGSGVIPLVGAQNVRITNLVIAIPNSEVNHSLSDGLKVVEFRARGTAEIKYAFTALESGTKYMTVPACSSQTFDGLTLNGKTLYLQTSAATVIEIIEFY